MELSTQPELHTLIKTIMSNHMVDQVGLQGRRKIVNIRHYATIMVELRIIKSIESVMYEGVILGSSMNLGIVMAIMEFMTVLKYFKTG